MSPSEGEATEINGEAGCLGHMSEYTGHRELTKERKAPTIEYQTLTIWFLIYDNSFDDHHAPTNK